MKLSRLWDIIVSHKTIVLRILLIIAIPLVYFFVYATGGIKYVYSHTMYIPILLAGVFGGILLGPFMPLETATGESQNFINWFYRLLVFMAIGGLSDYFSYKYKHYIKKIKLISSINQETKVPNLTYLNGLEEDGTIYSVFSVVISDHNYIKELFGVEIYNEVVHKIYI